jgi:peroxiredoxin
VTMWGTSAGSAQEATGVRSDLKPAATRRLAPDVALPDATGKIVRLSAFRGRVVLLDFWATSCGGCIQEIPMFIEVVKAYKSRGLEAIGVSEDILYEDLKGADEAWQRVAPFVRERKIPYPIVMGDSRVTADFDIKALPLTYLIDKKGRIATTYIGVVERNNLEANLKTLLAEAR